MKSRKLSKTPYRSYVYICYINGVPVYVGKGTDNRYLHCTSGSSSNPELNKAFFKYGLEAFEIKIVKDNLEDSQAFKLEKYWIKKLISQNVTLFNASNVGENIGFVYIDVDSEVIPTWVTERLY